MFNGARPPKHVFDTWFYKDFFRSSPSIECGLLALRNSLVQTSKIEGRRIREFPKRYGWVDDWVLPSIDLPTVFSQEPTVSKYLNRSGYWTADVILKIGD